ncbi:ACT domain-containing protein [Gracilibacillus sp. D59]|uniref:ACT domain-containing protein n=1 Tax=Gracilibacillus sp. D59 TaxID=3457434 RepID=UPI003FCC3929
MQKRAVVSVVGKDQVGIIAKVTTVISENKINILDISQTILQGFFTMIMLIEINDPSNLETLQEKFKPVEQELGLKINIQLEDVFQAMHRV